MYILLVEYDLIVVFIMMLTGDYLTCLNFNLRQNPSPVYRKGFLLSILSHVIKYDFVFIHPLCV